MKKNSWKNTTDINNNEQNRISDFNTTKRKNYNGNHSDNNGFRGVENLIHLRFLSIRSEM